MLVDFSVLIPLSRVGRLDLLERLFRRVETTREVYRECVEEGAGRPGSEALRSAFADWLVIVEAPRGARRFAEAEGIEMADASLILSCERERAALLSNDDHLVRVARSRGVPVRWLTSIVIAAVTRGFLSKREAKDLLTDLVHSGMWLSPGVFAAVFAALDEMPEKSRRN